MSRWVRPKKYRWELKLRLWVRHPYCAYCGRKLQLRHVTLDHVIPKRLGGVMNEENVVLACVSCNEKKAGMSFVLFIAKVEKGEIDLEREKPLQLALDHSPDPEKIPGENQ